MLIYIKAGLTAENAIHYKSTKKTLKIIRCKRFKRMKNLNWLFKTRFFSCVFNVYFIKGPKNRKPVFPFPLFEAWENPSLRPTPFVTTRKDLPLEAPLTGQKQTKDLITWAGLARLAGLVWVCRDLGMFVKLNKNQLRDYMTTGPAHTETARLTGPARLM